MTSLLLFFTIGGEAKVTMGLQKLKLEILQEEVSSLLGHAKRASGDGDEGRQSPEFPVQQSSAEQNGGQDQVRESSQRVSGGRVWENQHGCH
jgi:hypothetical protein